MACYFSSSICLTQGFVSVLSSLLDSGIFPCISISFCTLINWGFFEIRESCQWDVRNRIFLKCICELKHSEKRAVLVVPCLDIKHNCIWQLKNSISGRSYYTLKPQISLLKWLPYSSYPPHLSWENSSRKFTCSSSAENFENPKSQDEAELYFQLPGMPSVPCISLVMFNKQFLSKDSPF